MADSNFWRDLAERFRSLPASLPIRADWLIDADGATWSWMISGALKRDTEIQFAALARRGGVEIDPNRDSLAVWLDAVWQQENPGRSRLNGPIAAQSRGGEVGTRLNGGTLERVCGLSATLASVRENLTLDEERIARIKNEQNKAPRPSNQEESISVQIDRLREECNLTVEELAEALQIEPRSVYRHLSGKSIPRKKQIRRYQEIFSERTGRVVSILQTSGKRQ